MRAGAQHLVVRQQHRVGLRVPGPLEPVLVPRDLRGRADDHRPPGQLDPADGVVVGHDADQAVLLDGVDADGGQLVGQQLEAEGEVLLAVAAQVPVVRGEDRAAGRVAAARPAVRHPAGRLAVRRLRALVVIGVRLDLRAHHGDRVHPADVVAGHLDALDDLGGHLADLVGGAGGGRQLRPEPGRAHRGGCGARALEPPGVTAARRGRQHQGGCCGRTDTAEGHGAPVVLR